MKNYLLLILFVISNLCLIAQDGGDSYVSDVLTPKDFCKYKVNEVDEFTKEHKKILPYQTVSKNVREIQNIDFSLSKINDSRFLSVQYKKTTHVKASYCIKDGVDLMIKLENDSIIAIPYSGGVDCFSPSVSVSQNIATYYYTFSLTYKLDDKIINQLKSSKMKKIRIYFTEFYIDIDISPKLSGGLGYGIEGSKALNPQDYFIDNLVCIE